MPIETASGGIKAPQYFAPGVAGDHGEPIAQFFQVGNFLFPNNLPANAHGNGYADPDFLIASGYTGQTTETITSLTGICSVECVVGVPLKSYVSLSSTYYFKK